MNEVLDEATKTIHVNQTNSNFTPSTNEPIVNSYPNRRWLKNTTKGTHSRFGKIVRSDNMWQPFIKFEQLMTDKHDQLHWVGLEYELPKKCKTINEAKALIGKRAQEMADSQNEYLKIHYPMSKKFRFKQQLKEESANG